MRNSEPNHVRRMFDLNIETVLEHWQPYHAVREIIANALDEQSLTGCKPLEISKDADGAWHIRDFGRGLKIEHFTLNENPEKLRSYNLIGKFGVGLKDALATFHRNGITVLIISRYGTYTLEKSPKHDYSAIKTLHVLHEPGKPDFPGTEFIFRDLPDSAINSAKELFLYFRNHAVIDDTPNGQILRKTGTAAEIFINGVLANKEPSFLFSYNITQLTTTMRKALNRERVQIGRTVYAERVRYILKSSDNAEVNRTLANEYSRKDKRNLREELTWLEIASKALNELGKSRNVVCVSYTEFKRYPEIIDDIKRDGFNIITVNEKEKKHLDAQVERGETPVYNLDRWRKARASSFRYQFVAYELLTQPEREVFDRRHDIIRLVWDETRPVPRILISETMRATDNATLGVWDTDLKAIVIKRTMLETAYLFAGILLHEIAHAATGFSDCTREFENTLTDYLGKISIRVENSVA